MPDVTMPRLSDSMEEATIVNWLVADGDTVAAGQELAEVETDKATVSFEAEVAGRIEVLALAGETVALGGVVARIVTSNEQDADTAPALVAAPTSREPAQEPRHAEPANARRDGTPSERRRLRALASPVARRIAESQGIDLSSVTGSGPHGRIVKADLATFSSPSPEILAQEMATHESQGTPGSGVEWAARRNDADDTANGSHDTLQLSRTQELIARRMSQSRATIPDFDASIEVDMEAACELRTRLKSEGADPAPSLNDIIVMACGRALTEHPKMNSAYKDGEIVHYDHVNVGVAVAAEDSLVVATLPDTDRRALGDIARSSRQLAAKVRDGSISPAELSGATFTVSNLGMFGVDSFTAVLNTPQAGILAVGAVKGRAVARDGHVVCRRTAILTLAVDHRLVYGADAARFLARLRALLEAPLNLLAG